MKRLFRYVFVLVLACSAFVGKAQNDGIVFTMLPQMPYSNFYNPGIRVPYNGMIGLALSNVNVSVFNSSIKYTNIYALDDSGHAYIDGVKFVNSLSEDDNLFNFNLSMDLVNAGFRVKNLFFNIDWRLRMVTDFHYSRDFLGFFILGNGNYLGENACNFNIGIDATAFAEYAFGVQYDVNDKLTVGIRPKILSGIANVTVNNDNTKIYTDAETYAISADVNLDIKAASILESNIQRIGDITKVLDNQSYNDMLDVKENIGLGIDFGASYKFNEHFGLSAGVYDLGYIRWKDAKVKNNSKSDVTINENLFDDYKDLKNLKLDYKTMLNNVIDEIWGNDSLEDGASYTTTLQTRMMLQGYYEFNPMLRFSGIAQVHKTRNGYKPSFTVAYSGAFWNWLNLALSYSISTYTGNALGVGLGVHAGPFNVYAVSDNVLAATKLSSTTVEFATAYQTAGIRFGVVWTIGKYQGSKKISEVDDDYEIEEKKQEINKDEIDKEKEEFKEKNFNEFDE